MSKGLFITLEGGEGAGKSSLLLLLQDYLSSKGFSVWKTREPGGTALSEEVRQLVLNHKEQCPISSKAELFLFLAARAQHIEEKIAPALANGQVVLCDRFNDSTIVYQGMARGLGKEYVETLCSLVCGEIEPALTLFLDVDPSIGLQRTRLAYQTQAKEGTSIDRIEAEALTFHEKVRSGFLTQAEAYSDRIKVIDANQSQEEVFKQSLSFLNHLLCHLS